MRFTVTPRRRFGARGGSPDAPPNKALQLTSHSAFQSVRGTVWRRTLGLRSGRGGAVARS